MGLCEPNVPDRDRMKQPCKHRRPYSYVGRWNNDFFYRGAHHG